MIGIDTNILLRYFVEDDEAQFELAREILEEQLSSSNPGYVTLIVVVELVWGLKQVYKVSGNEIAIVLRSLLDADELEIERAALVANAIEHSLRHRIEIADALIDLRNVELGCSATLTFDQKFAHSQTARLVS